MFWWKSDGGRWREGGSNGEYGAGAGLIRWTVSYAMEIVLRRDDREMMMAKMINQGLLTCAGEALLAAALVSAWVKTALLFLTQVTNNLELYYWLMILRWLLFFLFGCCSIGIFYLLVCEKYIYILNLFFNFTFSKFFPQFYIYFL